MRQFKARRKAKKLRNRNRRHFVGVCRSWLQNPDFPARGKVKMSAYHLRFAVENGRSICMDQDQRIDQGIVAFLGLSSRCGTDGSTQGGNVKDDVASGVSHSMNEPF